MTCKKPCFMKSEDNTTDVLLMQLQREIAELKEHQTARLLIQDGKIAETCVYIKDNLSNELRLLLDSMQHSGELDDIITTAVTSSIELLQHKTDHVIPAEMYGAVGDGCTDDAAAIEKAINECGDILFFPKGTYKIGRDIVIERNNVTITGNGAYFSFQNGARLVFEKSKNINLSGIVFSGGALAFSETNGFSVDKCRFSNCEHGIVGSHCYVGNITRTEFDGCKYGVIFDKDLLAPASTADHNSIFVEKCKFYNNENPYIIRGGYVGSFSDNNVEGNKTGIVIQGMADFVIENNYFEYNKGDIITLKNYNSVVNSDIRIGGNRIFGDGTNTIRGLVLSGTIMGLYLETNSWGGLLTLIEKTGAVLSRPILHTQVNNTGKEFPNFPANFTTIDGTIVLPARSENPSIVGGRIYAKNNSVFSQTMLGDYVLDYQMGYVPLLNVAPQAGEGLLFRLPNGKLQIKIGGVVKTIKFE